MKTINELKSIAIKEGFSPNIKVLKKYFDFQHERIEDFYYSEYYHLKTDNKLDAIRAFIKKSDLCRCESEIIFFAIIMKIKGNYFYELTTMKRGIKQDKLHRDKKKLWEFINTMTKPKKATLAQIKFIITNNKPITIESEYLCNYLIDIIKEKIEGEMKFTEHYLSQKINTKTSQYGRKSKASLRPFVKFLRTEKPVIFKSDNKAYTFIIHIIKIIYPEFIIDEEKLQHTLKKNK